ncbi:hypothetical protein EW145_g6635 [Phellinidium pouzarii]|uniref:Uncharacterized protein n=1 Tax=Phellinidium pouzarii TaxID=167371 RepID=A0A4S4KWI2_9AGAM|nr:hypothetical protein EW145_g6635 [Phellinidium pouzarii]
MSNHFFNDNNQYYSAYNSGAAFQADEVANMSDTHAGLTYYPTDTSFRTNTVYNMDHNRGVLSGPAYSPYNMDYNLPEVPGLSYSPASSPIDSRINLSGSAHVGVFRNEMPGEGQPMYNGMQAQEWSFQTNIPKTVCEYSVGMQNGNQYDTGLLFPGPSGQPNVYVGGNTSYPYSQSFSDYASAPCVPQGASSFPALPITNLYGNAAPSNAQWAPEPYHVPYSSSNVQLTQPYVELQALSEPLPTLPPPNTFSTVSPSVPWTSEAPLTSTRSDEDEQAVPPTVEQVVKSEPLPDTLPPPRRFRRFRPSACRTSQLQQRSTTGAHAPSEEDRNAGYEAVLAIRPPQVPTKFFLFGMQHILRGAEVPNAASWIHKSAYT